MEYQTIHNTHAYKEQELQRFLLRALKEKEISKNGTAKKTILYRMLRAAKDIDIKATELGHLLDLYGYLHGPGEKTKKFYFHVQKLEQIQDSELPKDDEHNTTETFVSFEYISTIQIAQQGESLACTKCLKPLKSDKYYHIARKHSKTREQNVKDKKFDVTANMHTNFLNLEVTVTSSRLKVTKIVVMNSRHCRRVLEFDGANVVTLNREIFNKKGTKYWFVICGDADIVEAYRLTVNGSLSTVVATKRQSKETVTENQLLASLPRFGVKYKWMKYFTVRNFEFKTGLNHAEDLGEDYETLYRVYGAEPLTPANYVKHLQVMVEVEDLYINRTVDRFHISSAKIVKSFDTYGLDISPYEEFPYGLEEGDYIDLYVKPKKLAGMRSFVIYRIEDDTVYFIPEAEALDLTRKYWVKFRKDRTCAKMELQAIHTITVTLISRYFFPTQIFGTNEARCIEKWFNPKVKANSEQKLAIQNIVAATSAPAPYLLFGPPGTGKTSLLVEAITQIYHLRPQAKMLVMAPSNYACDELTSRLLNYIPAEDMYRYCAKSVCKRARNIQADVLMISNISKSTPFVRPSTTNLKNYRIVITTFVNAGRLAQQGMDKDHFKFMFFDECGSAKESETMIPVSGLISDKGKVNLVIAGDPKQLGAVVKSMFAEKAKFDRSMLERLLEMELYAPVDGVYNVKVITILRQNFRSHPKILEMPNRMFYNGELVACADHAITDFALSWSKLPRYTVPIIFHRVSGETKTNERGFSLYNDKEIELVFNYVDEILYRGIKGTNIPMSEIGILSPYRLQCHKISKKLQAHGYGEVDVGSAELFQGREKMVIIASMVRSNTKTVGFLGNPKRLNVIITRAKGLLIIIGNSRTLKMDPNWAKLIDFYEEHEAITGVLTTSGPSAPPPEVPPETDANLARKSDLPVLKSAAEVHEEPVVKEQQEESSSSSSGSDSDSDTDNSETDTDSDLGSDISCGSYEFPSDSGSNDDDLGTEV